MRGLAITLCLVLAACDAAPQTASGQGGPVGSPISTAEGAGKKASPESPQQSAAVCKPELFTSTHIDANCFDKDRMYIGDTQCFPFSEPRRFTGIVAFGFEHSAFYPVQDYADIGQVREPAWVDYGQADIYSAQDPDKCLLAIGCAFQATFVARQSLCRGSYGHMGLAPHALVIERMEKFTQIDLKAQPELQKYLPKN